MSDEGESSQQTSIWWTIVPLAATGWLLLMAFYMGGWRKTGIVALVAFISSILIAAALGTISGLKDLFRRKPWEVVAIFMTFALFGWFYFTDSYKSWAAFGWDAGSMLLGAMLGQEAWRGLVKLRNRYPPKLVAWVEKWPSDFAAIGKLLAAWIGVTVVVMIRTQHLPADTGRFANIGAATPELTALANQWDDVRVGLALSGGGYRAAVMHAGTLHALETLGVRVDALSTVSGGSIIGAYYAIGGDPATFKDAVASGHFNLKRELLLIHNTVRLPFPLTVPGVDVPLFPFYEFNRRVAQVGLLDRVLFDHSEVWRAPGKHQPLLVMGTTDLTFGLTVGLLPDGLLTISASGDVEAFRGAAAVLSHDLSLAERVAISGAFPIAFPPQSLGAKVTPLSASGTGIRPLVLADGGIADNSGLDLLIAADKSACTPPACMDSEQSRKHFLGPEWALDVYLSSDAGAIFGVQQEVAGMSSLARAFDVSMARIQRNIDREKIPVYFSAQHAYLDPGKQFRMYEDNQPDANTNYWQTTFDPWGLPAPLLEAIVGLLPESSRSAAQSSLTGYLKDRGTEDLAQRQPWSDAIESFKDSNTCRQKTAVTSTDQARNLPGLCDAVALRVAITDELRSALEAFRQTSTLDDQLPEERVDALYRLGHLLVYLQWRELESSMQAAVQRRSR